MIKEMTPLSMSEATEYIDKSCETDVKGFVKKFVKIKPKDAKELKEKLEKLELMKMKEEQIIKIVDLMPENSEDLNKIFVDVNLNEEEIKKVLETIKEIK
ncbi:MAG: hypothetical protein KKF68_01360 [Nanoarchaeota archaeon]|nr:hypothetical protein [Nanoarchaeota archaeon]